MKGNFCERGFYEMFESDYGRRILVLDGRTWYSWINDDGTEKLYLLRSYELEGYLKIREGSYLKTEVVDDREYPNVPHIYLQHKDHYHELILMEGLPNTVDTEVRILVTDNIFDRKIVESCICL